MKKSPLVVFVCVPGVDPVVPARVLQLALVRNADPLLVVQSIILPADKDSRFGNLLDQYCDLAKLENPPDIVIIAAKQFSMDEFVFWKPQFKWPASIPASEVLMYLIDQAHAPSGNSSPTGHAVHPGVYLSFITSSGDPAEACAEILESIAGELLERLQRPEAA